MNRTVVIISIEWHIRFLQIFIKEAFFSYFKPCLIFHKFTWVTVGRHMILIGPCYKCIALHDTLSVLWHVLFVLLLGFLSNSISKGRFLHTMDPTNDRRFCRTNPIDLTISLSVIGTSHFTALLKSEGKCLLQGARKFMMHQFRLNEKRKQVVDHENSLLSLSNFSFQKISTHVTALYFPG